MKSDFKKWILFGLLVITWGSSFILMKRGLDAYSSKQVIAIRVFSAFIVVLPFINKYYNKYILSHWKPLLVFGLLGILIPGFLFVEAQKGINSATISIINAMVPLFTMIIVVSFYKEKASLLNVIGILIGFVGASSLILINKTGGLGGNASYMLYALLAAVCNGVAVVNMKYYLIKVNSVAATVWALVFIGPIATIYLFNTSFISVLTTHPLGVSSFVYICLLGVISTTISMILFNMLLKLSGPVFAASVTYLVPSVAIFWGVFDGESIGIIHLISISSILFGVYLVNKKKRLNS